MNESEARSVLKNELAEYRALAYPDLVSQIDQPKRPFERCRSVKTLGADGGLEQFSHRCNTPRARITSGARSLDTRAMRRRVVKMKGGDEEGANGSKSLAASITHA
jgi:hypothetical protein